MFSCEDVARRLSDALDGEVTVAERARMRLHLWMCRPCAALERSLRRTMQALGLLADEPPHSQGDSR